MNEIKELLANRTAELIKDGTNVRYAGYCALTDIIKDLYCAAQGLSNWPDDIKVDNTMNEFHDWACSVADVMNQE